MADFYSVLPGIQPSQSDILEAEYLAKQILEAKFPNLDLREGTGLRDTVIRPGATLMAIIKKGLDNYFAQNTLLGVDDTTSADMVDKIMSNMFVTRNSGTNSTISVRLFFARAKNVGVPSSTYFSVDNKLKFFPVQSYNLPSSSMAFDSYSNEYYIDIELAAESEGLDYNISSGSLLYFSNFDPYFLRGEINYLVSESRPTETNTQFITRSKSAISTRNLINDPSLDFNLRSAFTQLKNILSVGMGETSMIRDLVIAMLPPRPARWVEDVSVTDTTATITLTDHGFYTDQYVTLNGASSVNINGEFKITVINGNQFSVTVPTSTPNPIAMPSVVEHSIQQRVHLGGVVDVYCSDSVMSEVTQLVADNTGKMTLNGPVYKLARSTISGGVDEDTVPVLNSISVALGNIGFVNNTPVPGTATCTLTSINHPFTVGETVTISGTVQANTITSISCAGIIATVTCNNHGFPVNATVKISGVTPTDYNGTFTITGITTNTFTYNMLANVPSAGSGASMTCEVNVLNGDRVVYAATTNTISVLTDNPYNATTGSALITSPVKYSVYNPNVEVTPFLSATNLGGGNVSIFMPRHGLKPSRKVTLSGLSPAGFNGSWVISSITDQDNFVVVVPTMAGNASSISVSNPLCTHVYSPSDFGFSTKQQLTIDFGAAYAGKTASFDTRGFNYLDSVQGYLTDRATKVICADYLARGFNLYMLTIMVTHYTDSSTALVQSAADTYINSLAPGQPFVVAELVSYLKNAGVTDIKTPIGITYSRYTRDLTEFNTPDTGTITDVLDPNDSTSVFLIDTIDTQVEHLPNTNAPVQR